jgi:hypothetical protein
MQTDNGELAELKEVYDELWSDATTLAKDMRRSISIYWYAGFLTLVLSLILAVNFIANLLIVLSGAAPFMAWYNFVMGAIGTALTLGYGAKLIQWYRQFSRKYSKLIALEKKLEEK